MQDIAGMRIMENESEITSTSNPPLRSPGDSLLYVCHPETLLPLMWGPACLQLQPISP